MSLEAYSSQVNESTKSQLAYLLRFCSDDFLPSPEQLIRTFFMFDRSLKGGVAFPIDVQFQMAIDSTCLPDEVVAAKYSCADDTVKKSRSKLIAVILLKLPVHYSCVVQPSAQTYFYLQLLVDLYQDRNVVKAGALAINKSVQAPVRKFFAQYAAVPDVALIFYDLGIILSSQEAFDYNRSVRYFLDINQKQWKGFALALRRYLFTTLIAGQEDTWGFTQAIEEVSALDLDYKHPQYFQFNIIRRFWREGKHYTLTSILSLAQLISDGGIPNDLGVDFTELATFLFKIYLINNSQIVGTADFYPTILKYTVRELLTHLRWSASKDVEA